MALGDASATLPRVSYQTRTQTSLSTRTFFCGITNYLTSSFFTQLHITIVHIPHLSILSTPHLPTGLFLRGPASQSLTFCLRTYFRKQWSPKALSYCSKSPYSCLGASDMVEFASAAVAFSWVTHRPVTFRDTSRCWPTTCHSASARPPIRS